MKNNHIIELSEVYVEKQSLQDQTVFIENKDPMDGSRVGVIIGAIIAALIMLMQSACTASFHVEWIETETRLEDDDVMPWDRLTENDRKQIDELNQKIRYGRN